MKNGFSIRTLVFGCHSRHTHMEEIMNNYVKLIKNEVENMRESDYEDYDEDVLHTLQCLAAALFAISDAILYLDGGR